MTDLNLVGNPIDNNELALLLPPSLEENTVSLEIEPTKNGLYLDPFSQKSELLASEEAIKKSQTESDSTETKLNRFSSNLALPQKGGAIRSRSLTTQELTGAKENRLITVKPEPLEFIANQAPESIVDLEMVDTNVTSAEVNVKVNFQPDTYETPAGYIPDSGLT